MTGADRALPANAPGVPPAADDALLAALPPPPARLWAGGPAPGALAGRLRARGYEVGCIGTGWRFTPDPAVLGAADAIVWNGVDAGFDPPTLFYRCFDLLRAGGTLILARPAAERFSVASVWGESLEEYLAGLAGRNGFRPAPPAAGGEGGPLRFEKGAEPRWRIRLAEERDAPALHELFRNVFGHEISPAFWQWKYGEGRGVGTVAVRGGEIVAHYGCIARRILLFGKPRIAHSIGDVMVQSRERAVFTRAGPFFLTTTTLAEVLAYRAAHTVAVADRPVQGFGFPNEGAMRVAEKTGLYVEVGRMVAVHWTPWPDRPQLTTRRRRLEAPLSPGDARTVDALWAAMGVDLAGTLVGVRDARWLCERYLGHPQHRYEAMLVSGRFSGRPLGVFVLRCEGGNAELVDIIAPLRRIPRLLGEARRLCARRGLAELFCWITQPHAHFFTATGGVEKPLDVRIPSSHWFRSPDPDATVERVRDRWWLMSGDTDFR